MKYRIRHSTAYTYSEPVPVCHNQVHLAPRTLPHQACLEFNLVVTPLPSQHGTRLDYFGNQIDFFSIHDAHLGLTIAASSLLEIAPREPPSPAQAPIWHELVGQLRAHRTPADLDAYQFTFASHHAPLHAEFAEYARPSFPTGQNALEAVMDLTARIHEDFQFDPRATTVSTPVKEVFKRRVGVCQDFAHFQIACLRSLGLAARYVSGYLRTDPPKGYPRLVGVDASHAWISLYGGELGWIDFDPTNNIIPCADHMTVAWGRDYQDVCPIQGVFMGGGNHSLSIAVDVTPGEPG